MSTITLNVPNTLTGTIIFSITPNDVGAQPVIIFNPNPVTSTATVTWTSTIAGNPVARNNAISLYITPQITQSAIYTVFISTTI
ncbi:hypothetical protein [Bacillus sp. FJAT-25509]|uniref:hypothetical protein n=1 Tax=Bacillus sp. FJAT-25509 TaxID=1712029 RepID=UPI002570A7EB|nr:hypothetical protein [Bacillus sp. FJAT-25509]